MVSVRELCALRFFQCLTYPAPVIDQSETSEFSPGRGFQVRLSEFEGPFDLLLHLISKHKLEVTELALHVVTDEFIAYIKDQGAGWDLDEATEFLVIAATLLDLKAARLLPSGEVEDEEDLAVLEARDLLFARLLQYKAFKEMAEIFENSMLQEANRWFRSVPLEEPFASLLPEVLLAITPEALAALASKALEPRLAPPTVGLGHLHNPKVSVREQAILIAERIKRRGVISFRSLVSDAEHLGVVVARFLALLELYRERVVSFEQSQALGELNLRWVGSSQLDFDAVEEFESELTEEGQND